MVLGKQTPKHMEMHSPATRPIMGRSFWDVPSPWPKEAKDNNGWRNLKSGISHIDECKPLSDDGIPVIHFDNDKLEQEKILHNRLWLSIFRVTGRIIRPAAAVSFCMENPRQPRGHWISKSAFLILLWTWTWSSLSWSVVRVVILESGRSAAVSNKLGYEHWPYEGIYSPLSHLGDANQPSNWIPVGKPHQENVEPIGQFINLHRWPVTKDHRANIARVLIEMDLNKKALSGVFLNSPDAQRIQKLIYENPPEDCGKYRKVKESNHCHAYSAKKSMNLHPGDIRTPWDIHQ